MTAMKARRGISGEQIEAIGSLVMVWPRVYQRRRLQGRRCRGDLGGKAWGKRGESPVSKRRECPRGNRARRAAETAAREAEPPE
jgi:hypothetical protein